MKKQFLLAVALAACSPSDSDKAREVAFPQQQSPTSARGTNFDPIFVKCFGRLKPDFSDAETQQDITVYVIYEDDKRIFRFDEQDGQTREVCPGADCVKRFSSVEVTWSAKTFDQDAGFELAYQGRLDRRAGTAEEETFKTTRAAGVPAELSLTKASYPHCRSVDAPLNWQNKKF